MTDPVPHENWIDAPASALLFAPPTDPPDDIDKALDAIGRRRSGGRTAASGEAWRAISPARQSFPKPPTSSRSSPPRG